MEAIFLKSLIALFLLYKFQPFVRKYFHHLFALYVFFVLFLWSLPRVVELDDCIKFLKTFKINTDRFAIYFTSQNIPPASDFYKLLPVVLSVFLFVLYLLCPYILNYFNKKFKDRIIEQESNNYIKLNLNHVIVSSVILLAVLVWKETIVPFYFTKDDNHAQFLPKIIASMQMLFSGEIPFIDNFTRLGYPIFELGIYNVLDPLLILSYCFSKFFFNNGYATYEIYGIACFVIGAFFLGLILVKMKADWFVGMNAIISMPIIGYNFIAGSSWYYVFGITCYLPILSYFFLKAVKQEYNWFYFIGSGIARAMFFYSGNVQFFLYGALIEFISYFYLFISSKGKFKLSICYLTSLVFSLGLIAPQLVPEYFFTSKADRDAEALIVAGIPFDGVVSSFLPKGFTNTPYPYGFGNYRDHMITNLYYIGLIWVPCLFLGFVWYARTGKGKYHQLIILALVLLFMAGGSVSIIYALKYYVPVVNKMKIPFKFIPFASFFIFLYGSLIISEIKKHIKLKRSLNYALLFSTLFSVNIAVGGTSTSFYDYKEIPYPKLLPGIANVLDKDDLIYSFVMWRYDGEPYVTLLQHNYSSLYDLRSFNFYETFLIGKYQWPSPGSNVIKYFNTLGITKVIVQKYLGATLWEPLALQLEKFPIVYEDNNCIIYETGNPKWVLRSSSNIPPNITKYSRNSLKAEVSSDYETSWEYHNEYREGYYLLVDGKKEIIRPNDLSFCSFNLPAGKHSIEISYMPTTFEKSFKYGMLAVILSTLIFRFLIMKYIL